VEGASDEELIERSRSGDAGAYGELVRRHQQAAFRTALAVCGDRAEAEDATQDAMIKAFHALHRFRAGAPWRPWLLRIVANEARNRRRSAGRRVHLVTRVGAGPDAEAPGPEELVLAAARRSALTDALRELDRPQREVVVLRHLVGLSEAECAAVIGCRPGTVKSRLSRALDRMRRSLEAANA
jgi:RNA polymerase sigma-70 factor (ECF subfamily)